MKTKLIILLWLVVFSSTAFGAANKADIMLVEKQHFTTKDFTTVSGVTLEQVDIGWESYGKLNANKDNVI